MKNYWVEIKKVGSKYTKLVPYHLVEAKIDSAKSIVNISGKEHILNIPKTEYKIVY